MGTSFPRPDSLKFLDSPVLSKCDQNYIPRQFGEYSQLVTQLPVINNFKEFNHRKYHSKINSTYSKVANTN